MSKQLNIHLFNCDRTYKLDVVEKWLNASRVKSKLGIDLKVNQHIFPLSKMTELSSKVIPRLNMDVAVFVLYAHESRLSINEENAGIGYVKLYRALLEKTGNIFVFLCALFCKRQVDSNPFVNNSEKMRLHRESGQNLHGGSDWTESENDHYRNAGYIQLLAKSNDDSIEATRVKQQESYKVSFFFIFTQY